ncbi:hypothetical protein WOC76_09545 [Methylocystis sp. IM3]|jgi:hypothetical protein|uniref:hypothetical protein n=1 Tax=unclassified Methylocystis TaxID=2625913 RepID=UPI000FAAA848|nr:MAG: hypothetical protein EKK29_09610 [Hyphomicrobiales bacterium]
MDFHPSIDRAIRSTRVEEEGSAPLPQRRDNGHDFDAPAWRQPKGWAQPSAAFRHFPQRLIDLERRARFTSLPLDQR